MGRLVEALHYKPNGRWLHFLLISVAERSKARVCGRLLAGIASSNPAGGHKYLCCVFCTLNTIGKHQDKELRIKYKERTKKNPAGGIEVCAAC